MPRRKPSTSPPAAKSARHSEAESPMRPDIGTQGNFKKHKPPQTYRYDSSLSPALDWDGQNHARKESEALIREIVEAESLEQAKAAASKLKALGQPFLNWAGQPPPVITPCALRPTTPTQ